jgi:hypothetical protein
MFTATPKILRHHWIVCIPGGILLGYSCLSFKGTKPLYSKHIWLKLFTTYDVWLERFLHLSLALIAIIKRGVADATEFQVLSASFGISENLCNVLIWIQESYLFRSNKGKQRLIFIFLRTCFSSNILQTTMNTKVPDHFNGLLWIIIVYMWKSNTLVNTYRTNQVDKLNTICLAFALTLAHHYSGKSSSMITTYCM